MTWNQQHTTHQVIDQSMNEESQTKRKNEQKIAEEADWWRKMK